MLVHADAVYLVLGSTSLKEGPLAFVLRLPSCIRPLSRLTQSLTYRGRLQLPLGCHISQGSIGPLVLHRARQLEANLRWVGGGVVCTTRVTWSGVTCRVRWGWQLESWGCMIPVASSQHGGVTRWRVGESNVQTDDAVTVRCGGDGGVASGRSLVCDTWGVVGHAELHCDTLR